MQELDVLRGLAAMAVVLFHYTVRYDALYGYANAPSIRVPLGFLGVEFFFCISGFVIFMTLDRTRRPMDFIVSRVSRLWPAYIAAICITFTVVHLASLPGRETTLAQAIVNLTMVHGLLHVRDVDSAYWSLQVELIFYCWMLLAFTLSILKRIRTLLWCALVPPIVYWAAHHFHDLSYTAGELMLIAYAPFFTIGIAAYNIYRGTGSRAPDLLLMAAAVAVATVCYSPAEGGVALLASIVFTLAALRRLRWLAQRPLVFLGTISYSLYLLHQNIGFTIIHALTTRGVPTDLAILTAIAVSIGLAAALTWTIERPARQWIRRRYQRLRAATPETALAPN